MRKGPVMIKSIFQVVLLAGILAGFAADAYAETLEGLIVSMDSKHKVLLVAPSGSSDPGAGVSVSVSEFIETNGFAPLDDLDVGQYISMTVQQGPKGQWVLTALKKPDVLVPPPPDDNQFLKTTGKPKQGGFPRNLLNKLKFAMK